MKRSQMLAAILGSVFCLAMPSWSSLTDITETQYVDAINKTAPVYQYASTDSLRLTSIEPAGTDLDGAVIGTIAASSPVLFDLDSSNNLRALSAVGNAWRTFLASSVAASWNASTNLVLTEDVRDGASGPGSAYTLTLILTKTGAVADLTRAALWASLSKVSTTSLAASSSGTTLTTATAMPSGWGLKAYVADGSAAAAAATLDPVSASLSVSVTPVGGAALTFSSAVSNFHTWNLATNSTTTKDVLFATSTGRSMKLRVTPALIARTSGISAGFISASTAMPKRVHQTSSVVGYKNTLPVALAEVLSMMDASSPASVSAGIKSVVSSAVGGTSFAAGDFTTTADTNKLGLVIPASVDLENVTWTVSGTVITATGNITGKASEAFSCDLSGIETVTDSASSVLTFSAPSGLAFEVRCLDSTGYDTSSDSTVDSGERDALLAMQLHGKLTGVGTIAHSTLKPVVDAALS